MKLKKWLSRGLVLAMVLALMVPVPVAAKSNGGGKLVKSVTYYTQDEETGRWLLREKDTFTYDKKGNPSTERNDYYSNYFLGIPQESGVELTDYAYKYKGKTPKSLKVKNSAGVVVETKAYKKGNVVKANETENWSEIINGVEKVGCSTKDTYATYGKKGYVSEVASSGIKIEPDGTRTDSTGDRYSYAWSFKKGLPSFALIQQTESNGEFSKYYMSFNSKGLVVEEGYIDNQTGAPTADTVYEYSMKKGLVKSVVVYQIDPETKAPKATAMYKFKYEKNKTSASRYGKMINDLVNADWYDWFAPAAFNWY